MLENLEQHADSVDDVLSWQAQFEALDIPPNIDPHPAGTDNSNTGSGK